MGQRARLKAQRAATAKALDRAITGCVFALPDGTQFEYEPARHTSRERKNIRRSYSVAMLADAAEAAAPKGHHGN